MLKKNDSPTEPHFLVRQLQSAAHYARTQGASIRVALLRTKLWISLGVMTLVLTVGGYRWHSRNGLVIGFFIAVAINTLVFFYDEWRLMTIFPSTELEGRDPWGLLALTRDLARQMRQPKPELREVQHSTPFLFSAGLLPSRLKIFISSSLVTRLTPAEVRAVIAHEILRSKTGLTQITTASVAIADLFLIVAGSLDYVLTGSFILRRRRQRVYFGPFTWMIFPVIAAFLRLTIPRKSFLSVDRVAAKDLGFEQDLMSAFVKLDAYGKNMPLDVNLAEAALFATDPLSSHSWSNWASVQPSLAHRATSLTGHYPL